MKEGSMIQVAYVVRDLEKALKQQWEICGVGPWSIYTFTPEKVRDYTYRGKPATHTCYIAVAWDDRIQIELMQPISGYSIYDEFLERKGEGLHHVKLYHADCAKAVALAWRPLTSERPAASSAPELILEPEDICCRVLLRLFCVLFRLLAADIAERLFKTPRDMGFSF